MARFYRVVRVENQAYVMGHKNPLGTVNTPYTTDYPSLVSCMCSKLGTIQRYIQNRVVNMQSTSKFR